MKIAEIMQSIAYVTASLKKSIQLNLVINDANSVSWRGYKSGIFKNTYYPLEYQWHLDNHQYSLILNDQSFFQFYYQFDEEGLKSARLAYYPRPISTIDTYDEHMSAAESAQDMEDEELCIHILNVAEEILNNSSYPTNTSHFRFDFDRSAATHEPSHIQFGGMNELRLPSNFFPLPYSFVYLVGSSFKDKKFQLEDAAISHSKGKQLSTKEMNSLISLVHPN